MLRILLFLIFGVIIYFVEYNFVLKKMFWFFDILPIHFDNIKKKFFTPLFFQGLKIIFLVFFGVFLLFYKRIFQFFLIFFQKIKHKSKVYLRFLKFLNQKIKKNPTKFLYFLGFFLLIFVVLGYYAVYFPALEDEVFAYTQLVSRGFFINIVYYPGPNHHVFFDLIAYFLSFFEYFFIEKYYILRFISVICGGILGVKLLNYCYNSPPLWGEARGGVQKYVPILLFFFIFFAQSPLFLMLFLGRGYALQILFGVILIENFVKQQAKARWYDKNIVFWAVLGFYTIPTFLYVWVSLMVYFQLLEGLKPSKSFYKIIFLNFWVAFWVFLLYSPIFLVSGIGSVFANDWVKSLSFGQFFSGYFEYFYKVFDYLFPIFPEFFGILLGILGIFLIFFVEKKRKILYLSLIFTPFVLIFFQKILPPERIFTYFYVVFLVVFLEFLNKPIRFLKPYRFEYFFLAFFIFFYFGKNHIKIHFEDSKYHIFAKEFVKKYNQNAVLKNQKIKIYVHDFSDKTYLMYEFLKNDKNYSSKNLSNIEFLNKNPKAFILDKRAVILLENNKIYDF